MKNVILVLAITLTWALQSQARQPHVCGSDFDVSFSDYEVEQAVRTHQPASVIQNLKKIAAKQKLAHKHLQELADFESRLEESESSEANQTQIAAFNAQVVALCVQIEGLR